MPDDDREAEAQAQWTRVTRRCPHCGARTRTLGSVCPNCGQPFDPPGLLERIPLPGSGSPQAAYVGPLYVLAALMVLVVLVLAFIRSWVAGTLFLAFLFVALVVSIGVTNWLNQR